MKTLKDLLQVDWAPTMEASARALVMAVAIPAAIALVLGQWLLFTWRRPLAGVLALVPVRKPDPIDAINVAALTRSELCHIGVGETMSEAFADVAADFGLTADDLMRPVRFLLAGSSRSDESSPRSELVAPPTIEISDEAVAGVRGVECWTDRATGEARFKTVTPQPPVLAPAPRRQRRGIKQPQAPA
jgi:hypothetical protein